MILNDLRYGLRMLGRQPGFTAVAVLTLALGIGANTAIFSIVNAVLLQPLPYAKPAQLVTVHESNKTFHEMSVAYPNFQDWVRMNRSFSGLAAERYDDFILAGGAAGQTPEHLPGLMVSANFFATFGIPLQAGPGFTAAADHSGGTAQAVVSYELWQGHFGGDPQLVGKAIPINGKSYTVVGITRRDFWFPWMAKGAQVFTLIGQYLPVQLNDRGSHPGITVIGRLRDGVSVADARSDMGGVTAALARQYPKEDGDAGATILPFQADVVQSARPTLLLLLGAVGLVLLIACANVANLLLARGTGRRRELAVRAALGASAGRITRQLLTESLLLGMAGGAAGAGLAWLGVRTATGVLPSDLLRVQAIGMNGAVLGFTLGAAVISGLLFGVIPALHSRRLDLQEGLKEGGRTGSGARHRSQDVLAVAEVALSLVLLAGAGLLIRSIVGLNAVAPGFDPHGVMVMGESVSPSTFSSGAAVAAAQTALLERVDVIPGVAAAAETSIYPLGQEDSESQFWLGGPAQPPPSRTQEAVATITTPGYLQAMGIPLLRGRFFDAGDDRSHPFRVVIDEVLAKRYFPGQDPVGQPIQLGPPVGTGTIIGVVGHVKFWGLSADDSAKVRNQMYWSVNQIPMQYMTLAGTALSLVVRSKGEALSVLPAVRTAVAGPEHDQPVYQVQTMEQVVRASLAGQRFLMGLLGLFALIAVVLAGVGIYGVLSYSVAQRTHEVGIRMALGAARHDVVMQIVRQGALLAGLGAAIGMAGSLFAMRLLQTNLYGVTAHDPLTLGAAAGLLLGLALLASYLPARRAAGVDPVEALRAE